ncbi:hypothetical protein LTR84_011123 [Exophiala bonariae]|uniref:N2227-like protein n=1 Tax=Exophiala bonariae TaxID=1690606 RepID=A0AAV9NMM3_9EURO|nr:hypothetical protein LTR84_011123 [Exophiala bonariae]
MALRCSLVGIALSIVVAYGLYIALGINGLSATSSNVQQYKTLLPTGHRHADTGVFHAKHQAPGTVAGGIPDLPTSSQRQEEQRAILLAQLQSSRSSVAGRKGSRYRLLTALYGFCRYEEVNFNEVERVESLYAKVPSSQRKMIERGLNYTSNFAKARELFSLNRHLVDDIVRHALEYYELSEDELNTFINVVESDKENALRPDRTSVSQALKHVVREWSLDGQHERLATFPCVLGTLQELCAGPVDRAAGIPVKVLLPGAGLNRLAHEIASLDSLSSRLEVTTNEFSPYMNTVYQYLLTLQIHSSLYFHPYPDNWSHQPTLAELHRGVHAPDILPSHTKANVTLVEGDFTQAFHARQWTASQDVLITHFFIDTARNLFSYLETIHRLLKPGGIWINVGPLLWSHNAQLQLSLEEVVKLSESVGFEFLESHARCGDRTLPQLTVRSIYAPYGFNHRTLSQNAYKAQFWVARKGR